MTGDYEDYCGDNEMTGKCENDCCIGCDAVQCRRSCRLHLFFRRYRQCHTARLHNPEVHLYTTAGRNTSRIASSPADGNMCKSPVLQQQVCCLLVMNTTCMLKQFAVTIYWFTFCVPELVLLWSVKSNNKCFFLTQNALRRNYSDHMWSLLLRKIQ